MIKQGLYIGTWIMVGLTEDASGSIRKIKDSVYREIGSSGRNFPKKTFNQNTEFNCKTTVSGSITINYVVARA